MQVIIKYVITVLLIVVFPCQASLGPVNLGNKSNKFLFIENNQDNNMFLSPSGAAVDPRFTGSNRWVTHKKGSGGQISLGYADNGLNYAVTGYKSLDMWVESSPIRSPYDSMRCRIIDSGCDTNTSTPKKRPSRRDGKGFYGLKPSYGWSHAKLSDSAYQYINQMAVGDTLTQEMNVCYTNSNYNHMLERCIDQSSGFWYRNTVSQTKIAHLKIKRTNAIAEIMVDSNGNPVVIPGSKGCEVAKVGSRSGVICEFLEYDLNTSDTSYLNNTKVDTGVDSRISGIDNYDIQKSTDKANWSTKGSYIGLKKFVGHNKMYLFLSNKFFKKSIALGLTNIDIKDLIYFNFKNISAVESGYYELSGTTTINVKPREFSVSIIPSDFSDFPHKEGKVGTDKLTFKYDLVKSAPVKSTSFEIELSQDTSGTDANGYCLFYPSGNNQRAHSVPVPAYIAFHQTGGGVFKQLVKCDNGVISLDKNNIDESIPPIITPDPSGDLTTRFYKMDLIFDLTDPIVQNNLSGTEWEGKVHQSGRLTLRALWL